MNICVRSTAASRGSVTCALVAVLTLALTAPPASAAHSAQTRVVASRENPGADVAPDPNYDGCTASDFCTAGPPCYTADFAPAFTSPDCEQDELEAIDNARAKEGVGPMYLPSAFNSLSGDEQLLVVIDLERVGRGLPPLAGIVASLDSVAQRGTQVSGQPTGTFEDPTLPLGFRVDSGTAFAYSCHSTGARSDACDGSGSPGASIAGGGEISVLDADYYWLYDDGDGGPNVGCVTPTSPDCWAHRDNILGLYPLRTRFISGTRNSQLSVVSARRAVPVMGAGSLQPDGGAPQGAWTAILASITGKVPAFVYSWEEALADGAGEAPGQ